MNTQSIIILVAIVLIAGCVVYRLISNRKDNDPCSGCSGRGCCGGHCDLKK